MPVFGLRFAAEMDARPRIQADLAFWAAYTGNAGAETEAALVLQLSDEYLTELEQVTPAAALKARLQDELVRRQAYWFGTYGRLQRFVIRIRASFSATSLAPEWALRPAARWYDILSRIASGTDADGPSGPDHSVAMRAEAPGAKMGRCHGDDQTADNDTHDEQNTHNTSPESGDLGGQQTLYVQ